ncbi:PREDICTED: salivary glue protein Sgs-3-like [Nicotiana attenuata]|uniref:salivary glue protein Sgs-3-like n=1 Tax=Nicotiana attenuata TaxID=49451 RepID=UPI000905BEB2|nr:PREDICTED: salivary glue protein Sgs-3-like [Nicotiana attenuata]
MHKVSKTPYKAKSSSKAEAKPKIMKPKSKKNAKPLTEPTLPHVPSPSISPTIPTSSSPVPAIPIIPTSTVSPPLKPTTHAPELTAENTSKSTKVKATPRKSIKKVPDAVTQGNIVAKESVVRGKTVPVTTNQVNDSVEEENHSEKEDDSEGEDQEKVVRVKEVMKRVMKKMGM